MKITELIIEQQQIDELSAAGVGRGIGKAAGGVVKGAGDFFKGLKQGYKSTRNPGTTDSPVAAASTVNQIKAQIAQKQQEIKDLQAQMTKTEPGIGQAANTVSATATNTPVAQQTAQGVAPQAETPPVEPGIGQATNTVAATAPAADPAEVRKQKQAVAAKVAQDQMAAQPAASSQEPAANKPSPEQLKQAQLKKNLMKNQQARTAAPAAPSGFSASGVGQARQRTYAGAGGAPKSYVVREGVEFYSKFLSKNI